jgi:hypothetical protein
MFFFLIYLCDRTSAYSLHASYELTTGELIEQGENVRYDLTNDIHCLWNSFISMNSISIKNMLLKPFTENYKAQNPIIVS